MMNYSTQPAPLYNAVPDKEEHKKLKKHYFKVSLIIITLLLVFNGVNSLVITICAALAGGGFSSEQIDTGKEIIRSVPLMRNIYSYGFPLMGDIAALGIGLIITKTDIKSKLTLKGFTGGELAQCGVLSFGIMTLASFVVMILLAIVTAIMKGVDSSYLDEALNTVSIAPTDNPLWLDILVYGYICLAGPILEELVFRGVLLEGLRKYGNVFGIIMSAVMFGLMHQNFMQCLPAVTMGIVWGYMAVKTGSLIPGIIIHIINNTLSAILMVMMDNNAVTELTSMTDLNSFMEGFLPLFIFLMAILVFRLGCIIASVIIGIRFILSGKKLWVQTPYTAKRTWKYIFTSVPWLIAMGYMIYGTVTSVTI